MAAPNPRAAKVAAELRLRRAFMGAQRPRQRAQPRPQAPTMVEADYARALLRLVAAARQAHAPLLAELRDLADHARAERRFGPAVTTRDAEEGRRARALTQRAREVMARTFHQGDLEKLAREFARRTATHQRIQLNRQTRAVLGVDAPITDRHLTTLIDGFVHENVALIQSIPDTLHGQVEQVVTRGLQGGELGADVAQEVEDRFSVAESRAKLIARDQIGKLNGQIAQARNQEMGVSGYKWRTANDERVRGRPGGKYPRAPINHWAREGKMFDYDKPPEGGHPGQDYQCRCTQEPDFSQILGDLDDGED